MMRYAALALGALTAIAVDASQPSLIFDPSARQQRTLTMPDGHRVDYIAYEGIPYVTRPEAPAVQVLNFYVPADREHDDRIPILLRNYSTDWIEAAPCQPSEFDATGRALREGMAVCIAGVRGYNTVDAAGKHIGVAPAPLIDLKAAIRYLRANDALMPGDAGRIAVDGCGSGGALAALVGTSGDNPLYAEALSEAGAADASDAVWAVICYSPSPDPVHADNLYEWLYSFADSTRHLDPALAEISVRLAATAPTYLNSLGLTTPDGAGVNADNYGHYIRNLLIDSAQAALAAGSAIPDSIGVTVYMEQRLIPGQSEYVTQAQPPLLTPLSPPVGPAGPAMLPAAQSGVGSPPPPVDADAPELVYSPPVTVYTDYVAALDLDRYLRYSASVDPLLGVPAYDRYGVAGHPATAANRLFGDTSGNPANFTEFSLRQSSGNPTARLTATMARRVAMMSPMTMLRDPRSSVAPNWYFRQGSLDTAVPVVSTLNLALSLNDNGATVDLAIAWNRIGQADYGLTSLMEWIKSLRHD